MPVTYQILTAEKHLKWCPGHIFLKNPYPLPRVLFQDIIALLGEGAGSANPSRYVQQNEEFIRPTLPTIFLVFAL